MLFMRGKAMSGAPIISGTNQLPKPPISAGMTTKNTMIRPCALTMEFQHLAVGEELQAGLLQLHPHQHRQRHADDGGEDREEQIEGADVLVVRAEEPARHEARLVVVMVVVPVMGVVSRGGHGSVPPGGQSRCQPSPGDYRGRAASCCVAGRRRRGHRGHRRHPPARISSSPAPTQAWNSAAGTACTWIGMNQWLVPQIWLHWP